MDFSRFGHARWFYGPPTTWGNTPNRHKKQHRAYKCVLIHFYIFKFVRLYKLHIIVKGPSNVLYLNIAWKSKYWIYETGLKIINEDSVDFHARVFFWCCVASNLRLRDINLFPFSSFCGFFFEAWNIDM